MAICSRSSTVSSPEHIHPALWRGTRLARPAGPVLGTGHPALDNELPGLGWPLGALIECLLPHNGSGELQLFKPALQQLALSRRIALLDPPMPPNIQCLSNWEINEQHVLCIHTRSAGNLVWAAQLLLQHNTCGALLCWAPSLRPAAVRQLQLAARHSTTLFVVLRPLSAARTPSAASLRLALAPHPNGLMLHIVKRAGPLHDHPLLLCLNDDTVHVLPTRPGGHPPTTQAVMPDWSPAVVPSLVPALVPAPAQGASPASSAVTG